MRMNTLIPASLGAYRKSITSQYGEDGVIERIFEIIGAENKWCVEFGAGADNNNTWSLVNQKGWSGVLIETHPVYYKELVRNYAGNTRVVCLDDFVHWKGGSTLDAILKKTKIPRDFDFLVIDIDGHDYQVWDAVEEYAPRVVMVEYNGNIPLDVSFVQPADSRMVRTGSSLRAMVELGKKKGYELAYAHIANAIFVRKDIFPRLGITDNRPEAIVEPFWPERRFFQGYDGALVLFGGEWGNLLLHKKKVSGHPVWFLDRGTLRPVVFSRDGKILRAIKKLLSMRYFYALLYPLAVRFYSRRWQRKKAQL